LSELKQQISFGTSNALLMVSKTCAHALRAMIYMAQHSQDGQLINIKEIAANIGSPELFIGKILQGLGKQGFLQSSKGRYGGFYIDKKGCKHSLADIVMAIDGEKIFKGCGVGLDYCSKKKPCPIHNQYKAIRKAVYALYRSTTLEQFKDPEKEMPLLLKRV
jgi:Rrf2 family protein